MKGLFLPAMLALLLCAIACTTTGRKVPRHEYTIVVADGPTAGADLADLLLAGWEELGNFTMVATYKSGSSVKTPLYLFRRPLP